MMQWRSILYIAVIFANTAAAQTYVIKFKSAIADTSAIVDLLQRSVPEAQSNSTRPGSLSVHLLAHRGNSKKSTFPWHQYAAVRISQKFSKQQLQSIAADPSVEYCEESILYRIYSVPNDSAFPSQWNLRRIGISSLWKHSAYLQSLPAAKVGVIDTGIDELHPDLQNSIFINQGEFGNGKQSNGIDDDNNGFIDDWRGYDFVDFDTEDNGDWSVRDNDPRDENGHGTAVSGIIGAQSNNGIGISGVARVSIVPLRAFGKNGNGNDLDIASAVVYAADIGVDVINMSFGDVIQSALLHDAVKYAYSKNIILVASSGNDGSSNPHYPSDFNEVISTGSVNQYDTRSIFSSNSPSLDIMAPGEQIVTTALDGKYTDQFSGTSAAAPHVSGAAALIKSIEKQKRNTIPSTVSLSNEEIRGILLNTADDAGTTGWDNGYGSGIVNAEQAVQYVSGSSAFIHSPRLDEILSQTSVPLVVTALSPFLQSVSLLYGIGENPAQWTNITTIGNRNLIKDTAAVWNTTGLTPSIYCLRLVLKNSSGNDIETRQRIVIQNSGPKIVSFRLRDSVIIGDSYGSVVEAHVDRNSTGKLFYRKIGELRYQTIRSAGVQQHHSFVITADDLQRSVDYEFYCQFTENSPSNRSVLFPTIAATGFQHFSVRLPSASIATTGYQKKPFSIPKGFILPEIQTIRSKNILILNRYTPENDFGTLSAFEFEGNFFSMKDSSVRSWVPRSFVGNTGSGTPGILVQDRGVSQLLQVDTLTGKYFHRPVWGDSSDVWASAMNDLDGDNLPEIIARNSSEYLIYKNNGNNAYALTTRLQNPTAPLSGEARNQYGPPTSIIGEFSNSGLKEIVVADYDGDVLLFRQAARNSLQFTLTVIDTSDLFETSDFLTAGDFNGDGIKDFAVASHSNLDLNEDREYDLPMWTVKIFSHRASDGAGKMTKIWEQHLVGVKAGSRYDNGISAGKLKRNDKTDALILSFNPYLYILEWNASKNTMEPKWIHPSQSNSTILFDFDGDSINDIGFHTNDKTEFWSQEHASTVLTPYGISALPLSSTKIRLQWNSSLPSHKIYRGEHPDSMKALAVINNAVQWTDTTVIGSKRYFYSVSALAGSESQRSSTVSAVPHAPPVIISVLQASSTQLIADISYDFSPERSLSTVFILDSSYESSSVVWKSSRSVLLTFPGEISSGAHTLRIRRFIDADGMEGDTMQNFLFTAAVQKTREFFVRSVSLLPTDKILVEFNAPPDFLTAKNRLNYAVRSSVRSYTVLSVDSISAGTVRLNADGSGLSRLALRLEVNILKDVLNAYGDPLNSGKGQVLSIAQETQSVENIVIFPNPVQQSQHVSFVNIPVNCRMTVYSAHGEKVKSITDRSTSEGLSWNLQNESGNLVSTGIYLYRIEQLNAANEIVSSKLGKFAVIR